MPHPHEFIDVWSVEGQFQHLIFSPKGAIEGVPTQFVTDPRDPAMLDLLGKLRTGQTLVIEGTDPGASHKGQPAHFVYAFERLVSVDGQAPETPQSRREVTGTVVRFN